MSRIIQSIIVGIKMSLIEMSSHKLRSFLSIIGVMMGVFSLVAMLTLIAGVDKFLNEKMGKWAGGVWFMPRRDVSENEKLAWSKSPGLKFSDGEYLMTNAEDVKHFYPAIKRRGKVHINGYTEGARIRGMNRFALEEDMDKMRIREGRWLSDDDYEQGKRACLISWGLQERIIKQLKLSNILDTCLLEKECVFKNIRFRIVGIFEPEDPDFKPWHLRRSMYIPIVSMQKYVTGFNPNPGSIQLTVADPEKLLKQAKMISLILTGKHRGVEDFEYRAAEWLEEISSMLGNISLLMTIISVISLVVGGLSIMNVMLSSISERIYEIGIRKALGAKRLQIFIQFITETMTLSFTGGIVGMSLGMIPLMFKEEIKKSTDGVVEPTVILTHIICVFVIIVFVGIIFGLYPALKASRMNPVEALRYE